jgi:Sec-independent protein secretion pathway component TatC
MGADAALSPPDPLSPMAWTLVGALIFEVAILLATPLAE